MKERPHGTGPSADAAFLRALWQDCWPNLAGLLGANLLFLVWCVPAFVAFTLRLHTIAHVLAVVTIGPALLGLFTYAANLALERRAGIWRDSVSAFRGGFRPAAIVVTAFLVLFTGHRAALDAAVASGMAMGPVALWAGQLGILCLLFPTGVHTLSLVGMYRQSLRDAFRNAALLTLAYPGPTVGVAAAGVLAYLTSRTLHWAPLVITPALLTAVAVRTTYTLVLRHSAAARN